MKGLILKDLIALKATMSATLILIVFYIILGSVSGEGATMFVTMVYVLNIMLPLTSAGYDEQCCWDSFGNALPVSRSKTVISRYLTGFIMMLVTILILVVSQVIFIFTGSAIITLPYYIAVIALNLLISAIINPILYKFGVQKGRFVMMAICLLPLLFAILLMIGTLGVFGENLFNSLVEFFTCIEQASVNAVALVTLAVSVVIYALSMLLSISIYKKKDF